MLHAWFGARPKVAQTRKMGVLPAQKCSGDALWAYLGVKGVGWYGCSSSARSALPPPPWSRPVAQPGAPDVYPSRARLRPHPMFYSNRLDTESFFERNTDGTPTQITPTYSSTSARLHQITPRDHTSQTIRIWSPPICETERCGTREEIISVLHFGTHPYDAAAGVRGGGGGCSGAVTTNSAGT